MAHVPTLMPLGDISNAHRRALCHALWRWEFCAACQVDEKCAGMDCPSRRMKHLQAFFRRLKMVIASYDATENTASTAPLKSVTTLCAATEAIKLNPTLPRGELLFKVFEETMDESESNKERKKIALNTVFNISFMTNCAAQQQSLTVLEHGLQTTPWSETESLVDFIDNSFPSESHGRDDIKISNAPDFEDIVTAVSLRRVAGLSLQPTDNLRNHLRLDRRNNVVEVFHYTGFLKEQLRLSKCTPKGCTTAEYLEVGALPRQLVLETLHTLQKVLFPQGDQKSRSILLALCSRYGFDRDCQRFEWTAIRHEHEKDLPYQYWLERLEDLKQELENPRPQGYLEEWLERRSRPRYVMMATLLGVLIAIVLGAAALAVSSYQAWVSYNAWKHPVPFSS